MTDEKPTFDFDKLVAEAMQVADWVDRENKIGRYKLDAHGEPVPCPDLFEWGAWLESANEARIIGRTEVMDGFAVSTVFLGLDHNHAARAGIPGADPRPILFETMVFSDYGGDIGGFTRRYFTRQDAIAGHAETVEALSKWLVAGCPKEEDDDA